MSLKASISGIRGVVGDSLTPDVLLKYISGFTKIVGKGDILIGRDSRPSGRAIVEFVKSTLRLLGRNVSDVGIVPTPAVLFGVNRFGFAGGIVVTASHNPSQWNALKLVNGEGKFFSPDQFAKLTAILNDKPEYADHNNIGFEKSPPPLSDEHYKAIADFVDKDMIRRSRFKVALDGVNGGAGVFVENFLKELGCSVNGIYIDPTGIFPHPPEPLPENLSDLSAEVKKSGASVGFALDPDGDRLVIVDESGLVLSEELTIAIASERYLDKYGVSNIVLNLSSSIVCNYIAGKHGVKVDRVPTGEIFVTEALESLKAGIGGEGNGGVIVPAINKCRDSLVGIALILDYMADTGLKISEIVNKYPKYTLIKKKFDIKSNFDIKKISSGLKALFKDGKVDDRDGIRVDFDDNKWVLIRASNTEPIVRLFAEAVNGEDALKLIDQVEGYLKDNS